MSDIPRVQISCFDYVYPVSVFSWMGVFDLFVCDTKHRHSSLIKVCCAQRSYTISRVMILPSFVRSLIVLAGDAEYPRGQLFIVSGSLILFTIVL